MDTSKRPYGHACAESPPALVSCRGAPLARTDRQDDLVGPLALDELVLDEVRLSMQSGFSSERTEAALRRRIVRQTRCKSVARKRELEQRSVDLARVAPPVNVGVQRTAHLALAMCVRAASAA